MVLALNLSRDVTIGQSCGSAAPGGPSESPAMDFAGCQSPSDNFFDLACCQSPMDQFFEPPRFFAPDAQTPLTPAAKTPPLSQHSAQSMSPLEAQVQSTTVSPPLSQTSSAGSAPVGLQPQQPMLVGGPQFVNFGAWPGQMAQMQQMPQMPQFVFCQGALPMQQGGCALPAMTLGMPPVAGIAPRALGQELRQVPGAHLLQHGQASVPQQPGKTWGGKPAQLVQQPLQKRTTSGKSMKKVEVPEERPCPKAIFVDLSGLRENR